MRPAYLGVTNAFALLRLLPGSDQDTDAQILALRHQLAVLQRRASYHHGGLRVELIAACVALIEAEAVGIVTLWLDGPLERRCGQLGTTPEALTADISTLLQGLLAARGVATR